MPDALHRMKCFLALVILAILLGCGEQSEPERNPPTEPNGPNAGTVQDPATGRVGTQTADHPIAGRSAFPAPGEVLDAPIPAKRLSDEDQFAAPIDPADIPAIVRWQDAGRYVGHVITVEGTIVNLGQSRDGKVNFLNFHQDWRGKFYLVVFDDLADTLDQSIEEIFKGKRIRVKGKVEPHRGRPQIKITSMDQVEFIDG